MLNDKLQIFL